MLEKEERVSLRFEFKEGIDGIFKVPISGQIPKSWKT
jgi:hypothetical protein